VDQPGSIAVAPPIKKASNPESVKDTERLFGEAIKMKGQPNR
jgi:hypothetical protein